MLESLLACPECADSELYVFMDEARNDSEADDVEKVRALFDNLQGFKAIHPYPARMNKGMARSVIDGVTTVLEKHESIIVLEDDLVVAPDFLTFMNAALEAYRDRSDIWSISGYTPNLKEIEQYDKNSVFLVPRAQCWGWATWSDRWETVDWEVSDFNYLARNKKRRKAFDMGGNDLFRTLEMEHRERIESWAVRWAYAASKQKMWTVNPMLSKVQNIGLKSSTSHVGWHDERHNVELLGNKTIIDPNVQPDEKLVQAFKKHHDLGLISKIGYFMRLHNLGYDFIKKILHR
ncbi:MAG: glycosyl transferase [Bacteroidales bacterium]|nr:glycosyl transferase [Bacteroidales bacterium]